MIGADECGKTSNTGSIEYYVLSELIVRILDEFGNFLGIAFPVTIAEGSVVESWQR